MNRNSRFQQKIMQFMRGRYGVDQLSNFLIAAAVVVAILGIFVRVPIFNILCWVLMIIGYIRIFSKNTGKRYAENQKFLDKTFKIRNAYARLKYRMKYGKQNSDPYYIYQCKKCGQKIRIPKGKGKIMITCPKCKNQFKKYSR